MRGATHTHRFERRLLFVLSHPRVNHGRAAARSLTIASTACWLLLSACGGASRPEPPPEGAVLAGQSERAAIGAEGQPSAEKQSLPPSGPARDIRFPPITRAETDTGLELNTVELHQLPMVQLQLVIRSGSVSDPRHLPGLAKLVAAMLKEGTKRRSSAQLAEAVEFLGADLSVQSGQDSTYISMRALREHLDAAMSLIAEVAMRPAFSPIELTKLKKRELDRLALRSKDPYFLVSREFFKAVYGDHPYARIETTERVVKRVRVQDLQMWHRAHFGPNNAFLVVVGDVSSDGVLKAANRAFRGWFKRWRKKAKPVQPPTVVDRRVVLVDRPDSVQSVIFVGNLALERRSADYVPLLTANQVLGGSASSRLFMDLREKRGLTYGSYSHVYEKVMVAPFRAYVAVRNEGTADALAGLMAHLETIGKELVAEQELADAKRYLVDSFPLHIETPAEIAELASELRIHSLPDDYWERFRKEIEDVTAEQALEAARQYVRPDQAVIVVVGKAAEIYDALKEQGPVTVVDAQGQTVLASTAESAYTEPPAEGQPQGAAQGRKSDKSPAKVSPVKKKKSDAGAAEASPAEKTPNADAAKASVAKKAPNAGAAKASAPKPSPPKTQANGNTPNPQPKGN